MPSRDGRGLTRFFDDGRVEIDTNVVERAIRPIALNRKNALFAGSDGGGEHWPIISWLLETCKLGGIDHRTTSPASPTGSFQIARKSPSWRVSGLLTRTANLIFFAEPLPSGS